MHAQSIVTRVLGPCLNSLHTKRANALLRATSALVQGALASLSGIALFLNAHTRLKHRVKSVDRLLGNTGLEGARRDIYRALAHRWLKGVEHILVVIDWSDLSKDQHWQPPLANAGQSDRLQAAAVTGAFVRHPGCR